jgi:hypothetical protein
LRVLLVRGHEREGARHPAGPGHGERALQDVLSGAGVRQPSEDDPLDRRFLGPAGATVEAEGAEDHAFDERPEARVIGECCDGRGQGVLPLGTTGQRGAGTTQVAGVAVTQSHQQHQDQAGVAQVGGAQHDVVGDLTGLPRALGVLEQPEEVDVDLLEELSGTRPEREGVTVP